jgi:hypothetical protein
MRARLIFSLILALAALSSLGGGFFWGSAFTSLLP